MSQPDHSSQVATLNIHANHELQHQEDEMPELYLKLTQFALQAGRLKKQVHQHLIAKIRHHQYYQ